MKKHEPLSTARAIIAFLILAIAFVIFYRFMTNQSYFMSDPTTLRNYVAFAIIAMALLIGLLYLANKPGVHVAKKTIRSSVKTKKVVKKKKR